MSRAPIRVDANRSIIRTMSELYLSIFVLWFRITRWKGRMKYITASFGADMVAVFIGLTVWLWFQVMLGYEIDLNAWGGHQIDLNKLAVVAGSLVILYASDFYLRRHGPEFERHFGSFSRHKRIGLYLAAVSIIVVTGIAFAMVGTEYRAMFHPPGK
jgi:hypothetical protein